MSKILNIGVPSKGRIKTQILDLFKKNKLTLISERGERDLLGSIKQIKNAKILYLHSREIIERLGDSSLDLGFTGFDLLQESEINTRNKINVLKKYDFGKASLVIAVPDFWLDTQTCADLEEIAFEFKEKKRKKLRVATKYPRLTREFLFSKGITQFKIVDSKGSTELCPFINSSEIVSDITSSGETLRANSLRVLKDGIILKSEVCMMVSKKSLNKLGLKKIIKIFSKKY